MPSHFQTPFIEGTIDDPVTNTVDSEFPPLQFALGTVLYVRDVGVGGTAYQLEDNGVSRFWFQISNSPASAATSGEFAPMYFSGVATFGAAPETVYFQMDPLLDGNTSPMRYPRTVTAPNVVRVAQLRVFISTNTAAVATATFTLAVNGIATALLVATTPGTADVLLTASPAAGAPITLANGDGIDLRVDTGAEVGATVLFGAEISFTGF